MKKISTILLVLACVLLSSVSVFAANTVTYDDTVQIEYVKINGDEYQSGDSLKMDLGETLNIRVKLQASNSTDNIQVNARLIGYEYSNSESVSDTSRVFDLNEGDTEYADLQIKLPLKADKDVYELRLDVEGRRVTFDSKAFTVRVAGPRSQLLIRDVIMSPSDNVIAGRSVLVQARLENIGERNQDDIKVTASIPSLGIDGSTYLDELDGEKYVGRGEKKSSEEIFLRIPECTRPGTYNVVVSAQFDEDEAVQVTKEITIVGSDTCVVNAAKPSATDKTIITAPLAQDIMVGSGGATYPVIIQNTGMSAKAYIVNVVGLDDWATYTISDRSPVVNGGESKVVYVFVSAKENTAAGKRTFGIELSTTDGAKQNIIATANVVAQSGNNLQNYLQIAVIVLVAILIVVALIVAFIKLRGDKDDDEDLESKGQAYY